METQERCCNCCGYHCKKNYDCYKKMKRNTYSDPELVSESDWLVISIASLGLWAKLFYEILSLPTILAEILSILGTLVILFAYWSLTQRNRERFRKWRKQNGNANTTDKIDF